MWVTNQKTKLATTNHGHKSSSKKKTSSQDTSKVTK